MKIYSIDLFSGIGGITHALKNIARPIVYCDTSLPARQALENLMSKGKVPTAPICGNVHDLNHEWIQKNCVHKTPKMIIAGFPCTSLSSMGLQQGFKEKEKSGLFYEILRLVDELDIPYLFLENVPEILLLEMNNIVKELVTKRGFSLRWCINSAENMGAFHQRKRWFCFAYRKNDFNVKCDLKDLYTEFRWSKNGPSRTVCVVDPSLRRAYKSRCALLGNSVVPDAVRYAFLHLVNGFGPVSTVNPGNVKLCPVQQRGKEHQYQSRFVWPKCGMVEGTQCYTMKFIKPAVKNKGIGPLQIDPQHFSSVAKKNNKIGPILDTVQIKHRWATPRFGIVSAANYLTERGLRDLPTLIRFEQGTKNPQCPVNPCFVENLMGYERDWTKL